MDLEKLKRGIEFSLKRNRRRKQMKNQLIGNQPLMIFLAYRAFFYPLLSRNVRINHSSILIKQKVVNLFLFAFFSKFENSLNIFISIYQKADFFIFFYFLLKNCIRFLSPNSIRTLFLFTKMQEISRIDLFISDF